MSRLHLRLRTLSVAIVATALLVAQLGGLSHRIEHPRDIGERVALAVDLAEHGALVHDAQDCDQHETLAHHDCAAYDAATLGDGPPFSVVSTADPRVASDRARVAEYGWPAGAPTLGYASRAPPRG